MEWSSNNPVSFIPQTSFAFLYNYSTDPCLYQHGEAEMKHQMIQQSSNLPMIELNQFDYDNINHDKKKRLTSDQLEALEKSFQEEIKLDPDRKMKLAQKLGLQPRQVAVWFQNRRARWKAKQLEHLYDALKQEFDAVFREKQKLQDEVIALRTILKEHGSMRQAPVVSTTDMSGEETVESTPMGALNNKSMAAAVDCNYMLTYDGASMHSSYCNWTVLPSYP